MTDYLPALSMLILLGIACILIWYGTRRVMNEPPQPTFMYQHSSDFFSEIADLIGIIGVIVTIISLSPLFLTFILGDGWAHILLTTQMGVLALEAIILATYFSAFFIYCLLALVFVRWIHSIGRNRDVRISDKIISLLIIVSGVITIGCLIWFLITSWFLSISAPMFFTGLAVLLLILGQAVILVLAIFIDVSSLIRHPTIRIIASFIIVLLVVAVLASTLYLIVVGGGIIYTTASNYTVQEKFPFSVDAARVPGSQGAPVVVALRPDYSAYPAKDINIEFANCHWSANYGYFFTVRTDTLLAQKQSSEFVIDKCIQLPNTSVYWTYDVADYGMNKPPAILSLQVEDANKKHSFENLGEPLDYVIGSAHTNLTWGGKDDVVIGSAVVY
ncbi:MAG: hypothetical protein LUQ71_09130 [Methanoregula sp.]|nr:hypothetical protein [Methanoregula sp.]